MGGGGGITVLKPGLKTIVCTSDADLLSDACDVYSFGMPGIGISCKAIVTDSFTASVVSIVLRLGFLLCGLGKEIRGM